MGGRTIFQTYSFALVICQHPDGRLLAVKESRNRGWWIPGGGVDAGETFQEAAIRETLEEAGVKVDLRGVLRVEHTVRGDTLRLRVIFYAVPVHPDSPPKQQPDEESEGAQWVTLEEAEGMGPWRGSELLQWGRYLQNGHKPAPLSILARERDAIPVDPL